MDLDGLRVAITGAARGTGRLLAEAFAERGAQIFLSARDLTAARRVADAISQRGAGRADAASANRCSLMPQLARLAPRCTAPRGWRSGVWTQVPIRMLS
jgi:NAD(P)-dependent dehydrogenase (short-subunit alcohol dehydrogenase family)